MWSNTDKVQQESCDQIQIMVIQKDVIKWTDKDKSQLERCDQIEIKVN